MLHSRFSRKLRRAGGKFECPGVPVFVRDASSYAEELKVMGRAGLIKFTVLGQGHVILTISRSSTELHVLQTEAGF